MPPKPRYQQITDDLFRRLVEGEFPVGSTLPSISALQEEYGVRGLNTIRQALADLQEMGLVESIQGRGTFVIALPGPAGNAEVLREYADELKQAARIIQSVAAGIERHLLSPSLPAVAGGSTERPLQRTSGPTRGKRIVGADES